MKALFTGLSTIAISFALLGTFTARASDGIDEPVIQVDCTKGGKATMDIDGEEVTVNCGTNTPTVCGEIPKEEHCIGTAFACMKGKDCLTISGGIKFHRTNCGSG